MKISRRSFIGHGLAALAALVVGKRAHKPFVGIEQIVNTGLIDSPGVPCPAIESNPSSDKDFLDHLGETVKQIEHTAESVRGAPCPPLISGVVDWQKGSYWVLGWEDRTFRTDDISADPVVWTEIEAGEL